MISMIVAKGKNHVIGKDNQLIWHLPNDLKYFKERTMGHTIVMGRNTLESLPFLLPGREHWVITNNRQYESPYEDVRVFHSIEEVLTAIPMDQEVFCIGGAQIFKSMLPYVDRLYVTEIDEYFEGDVWFPPIPETFKKVQSIAGVVDEKNIYPHRFDTYERE